jgi:hypothetical protein
MSPRTRRRWRAIPGCPAGRGPGALRGVRSMMPQCRCVTAMQAIFLTQLPALRNPITVFRMGCATSSVNAAEAIRVVYHGGGSVRLTMREPLQESRRNLDNQPIFRSSLSACVQCKPLLCCIHYPAVVSAIDDGADRNGDDREYGFTSRGGC